MNIALVSMNANPLGLLGGRDGSGQTVLVDGLARALAALGHRITVYARRDKAAPLARLSMAPNVAVVQLGCHLSKDDKSAQSSACVDQFAAQLDHFWRVDPPQAVHAFGAISGHAALAGAPAGGPPLVQTFGSLITRGPRHDRLRDKLFAEQAALVRSASRIVALSSSQVFALMRLGASPAAISFVPCGVDLERFAPQPPRQRTETGRLRIATLSGLSAGEGVADVIEALAYIDDVELIIGGGLESQADILSDPDAARLQAVAHTFKVADRVEFRGHIRREEVPRFLRAADVVVSVPHEDSIGTVALEAMACGVPLIVSTVGGLVDAVTDGMTGIHVPPRSARQIAYALDALRADQPRRERLGRLGAQRTSTRYGWSRIAADAAEIYRGLALRTARHEFRGLA